MQPGKQPNDRPAKDGDPIYAVQQQWVRLDDNSAYANKSWFCRTGIFLPISEPGSDYEP